MSALTDLRLNLARKGILIGSEDLTSILNEIGSYIGTSGTNTGDVTLAAVGAAPNANGATLTAQVLNLEPASGTQPGILTTGAQTIAGAKTFSGAAVFSSTVAADSLVSNTAVALTLKGKKAAGAGPDVILDTTNAVTGTVYSFRVVGVQVAAISDAGALALSAGASATTGAFSSTLTCTKCTASGASGYGFMLDTNVGLGWRADGAIYSVFDGTNVRIIGAALKPDNGLVLSYTDSSGTPGAATINKPAGRSAIAAGASSCVITNSFVAATSIVQVNLETRDATGVAPVVVPGSGSFTVSVIANATGTTKFSWTVVNVI